MTLTIDEQNIKRLLKEALLELFEERQELFYELVSEVIADAGLIQAIKDGEDTEYVSRDEVFAVLDNLS
jgi:ferritin-like metal-binding protein YciE